METPSALLEKVESLQKFCLEHKLKYAEDDIRVDFFGMLYDILDNYYKGYLTIEFSKSIYDGNASYKQDFALKNKNHFNKFAQLSATNLLYTSFTGNLNRRLIIDTWSTFELSINLFSDAVLDQKNKEELLHFESDDITKILLKDPDLQLKEETKKLIKSRFDKKHLTHVPINRKVGKLLKLAKKSYCRDKEKDLEFLTFYGKLRNTMHANFIYFGSDYEYNFRENNFVFTDGKMVVYQNKYPDQSSLYVELFNEIKDIFYNVILSINHSEPILYPDTGIYWDE